MRNLADALGASVAYLLGQETAGQPSNITEKELRVSPLRLVPVISWACAGSGGNFSDLEEQIDERIETESRDPNCYALIIEGDSMLPKFEPGDRITFEPNREAVNGDVVVARLADTGQVYFKLFHRIGQRGDLVRLTSFNQLYPPLEFTISAFRFIHPMLELKRRWRR